MSGRIDFSKADPEDPMYLIKEEWVLNEVLKENLMTVSRAELLSYASRSVDIRLSSEGYQAMLDGIVVSAGDIRRISMPWAKVISGDSVTPRDNIKSMAEAWKQVWGDPNDPATAAAIDNTVKVLLRK